MYLWMDPNVAREVVSIVFAMTGHRCVRQSIILHALAYIRATVPYLYTPVGIHSSVGAPIKGANNVGVALELCPLFQRS